MSDRFRFDAVLEPMTWGKNTYTIIRVPTRLVEAAERWPTRRIDGSVDELSIDLGLNKADSNVMPGSFVYIGAGLQRRLGVRPGDLGRANSNRPTPIWYLSRRISPRRWRRRTAHPRGNGSGRASAVNC